MFTNVNNFCRANDEGSITVTNRGDYLVTFGMTFLYQGSYITLSSPILTPYPYTIGIPASATDITVDVFGHPDLSEAYTICFYRYKFPVTKCFVTYGVPFNWGCNEVPCPPNISNNLRQCNYNSNQILC